MDATLSPYLTAAGPLRQRLPEILSEVEETGDLGLLHAVLGRFCFACHTAPCTTGHIWRLEESQYCHAGRGLRASVIVLAGVLQKFADPAPELVYDDGSRPSERELIWFCKHRLPGAIVYVSAAARLERAMWWN